MKISPAMAVVSLSQGTLRPRSESLARLRLSGQLGSEHYGCRFLGDVRPDQQGRSKRQFPSDPAIGSIVACSAKWGPKGDAPQRLRIGQLLGRRERHIVPPLDWHCDVLAPKHRLPILDFSNDDVVRCVRQLRHWSIVHCDVWRLEQQLNATVNCI